MSSEFGKILKISVFGESHGHAVGVNIDGLPAGEHIDTEALQAFMDRRRPGRNMLSTQRKEADTPVFLSGLCRSVTCGTPVCAIIENSDSHPSDYDAFSDTPRPSHADYTAKVKWHGHADMRGGGHFSGRLTAPLCIAGGMAKQILARRGIYVGAHLLSVSDITDTPYPSCLTAELMADIEKKDFPVLDDGAGRRMQELIHSVRAEGDSVGGVIECAVVGLPSGLGSPMFDGIENRLAYALFGIPAVKGIEFGAGFGSARLRGSENNDPFTVRDGTACPASNRAGGILGGITTGMPVIVRGAVKPTPSVSLPQTTVSLSRMKQTELCIGGRHDPCIAHRAVPVFEAVTAAVILDILLEEGNGAL